MYENRGERWMKLDYNKGERLGVFGQFDRSVAYVLFNLSYDRARNKYRVKNVRLWAHVNAPGHSLAYGGQPIGRFPGHSNIWSHRTYAKLAARFEAIPMFVLLGEPPPAEMFRAE